MNDECGYSEKPLLVMNMQNPTQTMHVYDMPLRVIAGLSTLPKPTDKDDSVEIGTVVTEVGNAVCVSHPAWKDPFMSYQLRAARDLITPDFIFGRLDIGNAYSAFLPRRFAAPAVGTRLVIQPVMTAIQAALARVYNYIHCNFHYIIHVPAPLGTGIYLKVYAPELDETTVTRGIRFKPSDQPSIAVSLPWSNDLSTVPIEEGRLGQSGGAIVIETIEDNSNETVNSPLSITVWCCVADITVTGYTLTQTEGVNVPGINFIPQPVPTPPPTPDPEEDLDDFGEHQMDNEVSAEGGKENAELDYDKSAIPLAPEVEQPAAQPQKPVSSVASRKNDTGHLATKWYEYTKISLASPSNMAWTVVTINPYENVILSKDGESMVLPWKRNVWTTGSQAIGYIRSMVVQLNIPRPPQISGVLEVKDSINSSSITLVEFGGKVEIPIMPKVYNGLKLSSTLPRHWLNPWMRTAESTIEFAYRVIAFNRTSDISDLNVSILLRPGDSQFQIPTKPDLRVAVRHHELLNTVHKYYVGELDDFGEHQGDLPELNPAHVSDPAQFITPSTALTAEEYNVHTTLGSNEELELDEFPVLVFKGDIPVNEVTAIPLDLAKIYDLAWDGEQNAISQKFQRFAHLIPQSAGGFGPVMGNYTITLNLPTGVAGRIVHNCLPGDSVDLTVARIFGLKSLLGVAGSAVSAIGGPLMNGLVNTAAPILSGAAHAIGGNVVGGLADAVINTTTSLLTPGEKAQPSANSNAISGDIPISRFVEMVKFVESNFTSNPIFPTLLIEPQNFIGNTLAKLTSIPVEVFANMRNVAVERNLFDRTVVPVVEPASDVVIPSHYFSYILRDFLQHSRAFHEGEKQNIWFKKFLQTLLTTRDTTKFVFLRDIRNAAVSDVPVTSLLQKTNTLLRQQLQKRDRTSFGLAAPPTVTLNGKARGLIA